MGKAGQARLSRCVAVGCRGNGARRRPLRGGGRHYGPLQRRERARVGKRGVGVRRRPLGRQAGQRQAVNGLREELLGERGPEEAGGPR